MRILLNPVITLLLILNGVSLLYSQDAWIRQQTPTAKWLNRCSFPDSINGWAAGEDGVIIRTSNGGSNWSLINSPVDFFIYDIYFFNSRLGWALANDNFSNGTAVLSTTNGGDNWSFYRYPDSNSLLYAVYYTDSLNGMMAGYPGKLIRTTNGGINWITATVDSAASLYFPIYRLTAGSGLWAGSGGAYDILGAVWVSTNGGFHWKTYPVAGEPIFSLQILSSQKILALGGDFEFGAMQTRTYNTGANWTYDYLNTFGIPRGLSFRTEEEAWAVLSISARFFYTLDTGNTWNVMDVPDSTGLYDIKFTDPRNGFAVGLDGAVYKYNPKVIGIHSGQTEIPLSSKLFQNYPNPFNPQTTIEYYLVKPSVVKISVYDVTGRLVKEIHDGVRPQGNHSIRFESSGLSSGMYIYKLEAGSYTETKKMVIVK